MPDIVIAGATFHDVPQIDIPKDGGGTASFTYENGTKSITENGTHDVSGFASAEVNVSGGTPTIEPLSVTANGTYTAPSGVDGYSPVTVNVSGGGGSSDTVTGTFTFDTAGAHDITIPYTGSGHILDLLIVPVEGVENPEGDFFNTIWYRGILAFLATKNNPSSVPDYESTGRNKNKAYLNILYKSSSSTATTVSAAKRDSEGIYVNADATTTYSYYCLKIKSNTVVSVRVSEAGAYGFALNVPYRYVIHYSS